MAVTNLKTPIPLEYFAQTMGIDPLVFNSIDLNQCVYMEQHHCDFYWDQYPTGRNMYNREQLAECLCSAYDKVSNYLGVKPTLQWECDTIDLQNHWFHNNPPGRPIEEMVFRTKWNMVKEFGQKQDTFIDTVSIDYEIHPEFPSYATFSVVVPDGIDVCDIKAYFKNTRYEVEPIELEHYDEETREAQFVVDSWLLALPSKYMKRSWNGECKISCNLDNFAKTLDVFAEHVSDCLPQVELIYPEGHSCSNNCRDCKQPACVRVIDSCNGYFKIVPQTYDENGCVTDNSTCPLCTQPYKMKVWYRAGCHKHCTDNCDSYCYCHQLIETVNILAACCLDEYPDCDCGCVSRNITKWQAQTALISKNNDRWSIPASIRNEMSGGFGTKYGEIEALLRLNQLISSEQFCNRE